MSTLVVSSPRIALGGAAILLVALLVTVPASAQQGPCAGDIERLCPGVTPGPGTLTSCLKPHEGELSPACKRWLQRSERRQKVTEGRRRQMRTARAAAGTPKPRARGPAPTPKS